MNPNIPISESANMCSVISASIDKMKEYLVHIESETDRLIIKGEELKNPPSLIPLTQVVASTLIYVHEAIKLQETVSEYTKLVDLIQKALTDLNTITSAE